MSVHSQTEYERSPWEEEAISSFLDDHFDSNYDQSDLSEDEIERIKTIIKYVHDYFSSGDKYIIGLPSHFALLAQELEPGRGFEPDKTAQDILDRYERKTKPDGSEQDTLTLLDGEGGESGIRPKENRIRDFYHERLDRLGYPSSPGHFTSKWPSHKTLLRNCFWLSQAGRYVLINELFNYGLSHLEPTEEFEGNLRVRLLPLIISDYKRGGIEEENGGLVFQAIAYGYFKADRPHLSIEAAKVRVGSSRQKRIGDIDCYSGVRVELSVEVKDFELSASQIQGELGKFIKQTESRGIRGVALLRNLEEEARIQLQGKDIQIWTERDLLNSVRTWDWPKQNRAVQGIFHYLAHIEENTFAVNRLQHFVHEHDEDHEVLDRFNPESEETSDPQQELELE